MDLDIFSFSCFFKKGEIIMTGLAGLALETFKESSLWNTTDFLHGASGKYKKQ